MKDERTSVVDATVLAEAHEAVRSKISAAAARSGRSADDVRIVAAAKYLDAAATAAIVDAGVADVAENRMDGLIAKRAAGVVAAEARWHFIGRLQSRQAAEVAANADAIHTLCSASAAKRLAVCSAHPDLLVQVNVDGDPGKDGLAPAALERFLDDLPAALAVVGLMTMPARANGAEHSRAAFASLRELRDQLAPRVHGRHDLRWLSMGTSQDFAVAVEEGATHVRLGRILYASGELRG